MNNKLICPFCKGKLEQVFIHDIQGWACTDLTCKGYYMTATKDMWQELIRTRKALDVAWDGLKRIGSGNIIEHSVVGHENDNKIFIANKALDESKTALEQKDVK